MSFCYLDVETTGLEVLEGHRVVSLGIVDERGKRYYWTFNPERPSSPGATKIHGLTDDFLKTQSTFSVYAQDIIGILTGKKVVAYNAPFDQGFIENEIGKCHLHLDCEWVDALELVRKNINLSSYRLVHVCRFFELEAQEDVHNALKDALLARMVHKLMLKMYPN